MNKSLGMLLFIVSIIHTIGFGMSRGPALAKHHGFFSPERLALEKEHAGTIKKIEEKESDTEKNYKQEFFALGSGNAEAFFEKQGRTLEALEKEKALAGYYYQKQVDALMQKKSPPVVFVVSQKEETNCNQLFNEALDAISKNSDKRMLQNILLKINDQCPAEELKKYLFQLTTAAEDYKNEFASELIEQIFFR